MRSVCSDCSGCKGPLEVPTWLRTLLKKGVSHEPHGPAMDLLVVEGADAGQQFTLDGDEILIGRDLSGSRGILLHDPTVSAKQAILRRENGGFVLEQVPEATNPTLLDGRRADGSELSAGARIVMGRTVIEVRRHDGISLSNLTRSHAVPAIQDGREPASEVATTQKLVVPQGHGDDSATTEFRTVVVPVGQLIVESGFDLVSQQTFPIWSTRTILGRSKSCDVRVADMGISRSHADLVWDGDGLELVHHSQTNSTLLNGCEVLDRERVQEGDVIQLADRVSMRVELTPPKRSHVEDTARESDRRTLRQEMEDKVRRDLEIEEKYAVEGSFLDVDVVNSYGMKAESTRAEHIIVSFERFRSYVGSVVAEFGGQVLNSNGDELMCYFESTLGAVEAGSALLTRLDDFNRESNLLAAPFAFRVGVHTGRSLVDLDQGVAYSPVLDVAGHLQKVAEHNGLAISQQTLEALPEGLPFEHAGILEREGLEYYKLSGPLG